jgi:hypothetical protein
MSKLILLALVLESVAVPILMAESRSPRRAVRYVQYGTLAFVWVWAYLCLTWYPQLVTID